MIATTGRPSTSRLPRPAFLLFIIFAGLTSAFCIQRLQYLDIERGFCRSAVPGECFWFARPGSLDKLAFQLHLGTMLPAGILACVQFLPARLWTTGYAKFHRTSGYVTILLSLVGTGAAVVVARRALGGTRQNHFGMGLLGVAFLFALREGYVAVRKGRLDLHRAWMLRAWFWAGSIITTRAFTFIAADWLTIQGGYVRTFPCEVVQYMRLQHGPMESLLPMSGCFFSENSTFSESMESWTTINADVNSQDPAQVAAALQHGYVLGGWVAMILHAVGIELYLYLTSAESTRLRAVSKHRKLAYNTRSRAESGKATQQKGIKVI